MFNSLIFDDEMMDFICNCPSRKIADILLDGNTENGLITLAGNFIKREDGPNEVDVLSYLPKSKQVDGDRSPWDKGIGRTKIRIGRFLRKFLTETSITQFDITDKDIEQFVNFFKSYFNSSTTDIKIVEGSEILNLYLEENYYKPNRQKKGTLWNSCMRYRDRNKFMRLYSSNPNIKMAVLYEDGLVRTRSLLWSDVKDSDGNEYKVMDRIYSVYDHDFLLFKKWAHENGYLPKFHQTAKSEKVFDVAGFPVVKDLIVKLDNYDFSYYPYLDTFKFFNFYKGTFANSTIFNYDYVLVQSNGGLEPEPEPEEPEYYDDNEWN